MKQLKKRDLDFKIPSLFFSRQSRHPDLRQLPRDVHRPCGHDRAQEVLLQTPLHVQVRHDQRRGGTDLRRKLRQRDGGELRWRYYAVYMYMF